jgi:hypothetical protein
MTIRDRVKSQIDVLQELRRLHELTTAKLRELEGIFDTGLTKAMDEYLAPAPVWEARKEGENLIANLKKVVAKKATGTTKKKRKYTKKSKWWGKKKKK